MFSKSKEKTPNIIDFYDTNEKKNAIISGYQESIKEKDLLIQDLKNMVKNIADLADKAEFNENKFKSDNNKLLKNIELLENDKNELEKQLTEALIIKKNIPISKTADEQIKLLEAEKSDLQEQYNKSNRNNETLTYDKRDLELSSKQHSRNTIIVAVLSIVLTIALIAISFGILYFSVAIVVFILNYKKYSFDQNFRQSFFWPFYGLIRLVNEY